MRTEKIDASPVPKVKPARENPAIPIIEEFERSGDQYHQVFCDKSEYEKVTQKLRSAANTLGVNGHIKVHNTYQYDDDGNKKGRILWLENTKAS